MSTAWQRHRRVIETPEEFWDLQRTYSSMARKRLSSVPPEKVEAFRKEFLEICRTVQSKGGQLAYPFAGLFVIAQHRRVNGANKKLSEDCRRKNSGQFVV